mmetsp:Transcript_35625/g.83208  ORF Transcript_35625/g.83208 Transcript_35625/m.83208 type:complete len:232 (-) Transcript_35625:9-704(-)
MRGFNGGQLGFEGLGLSQRLIPQHLCDRLHASHRFDLLVRFLSRCTSSTAAVILVSFARFAIGVITCLARTINCSSKGSINFLCKDGGVCRQGFFNLIAGALQVRDATLLKALHRTCHPPSNIFNERAEAVQSQIVLLANCLHLLQTALLEVLHASLESCSFHLLLHLLRLQPGILILNTLRELLHDVGELLNCLRSSVLLRHLFHSYATAPLQNSSCWTTSLQPQLEPHM